MKSAVKPHDDSSYPVQRSPQEWREQLGAQAYAVAREGATERAFTGDYWNHWDSGDYHCRACGEALFRSSAKFDAGCGWPSYDREAQAGVIERLVDTSHGMVRVEVRCQRCGSHLGHVFNDGPTETGERYCINSAAIHFAPQPPAPTEP
jgi:peptide-methionine (R)-S-oxide reductase